MPIVSRASIAACAAAALASANHWPTTGLRWPAAAACSARSDSARSCCGRRPLPRSSVTPASSATSSEIAGERAARHAEAREPPAGADELEGLAGDRAADAVEDDVDRAGLRRPAGLRVVDGVLGAEAARELGLALAACGCDDARAGARGELHEQAPDAAGRGLDEDGLARLDLRRFEEHERRAAVGEQRDGVGELEAVGDSMSRLLVDERRAARSRRARRSS